MIVNLKGRGKRLYWGVKYRTKKVIVPLGCDCQPAYILNHLGLRKQSLPFDWLNIQSNRCLSLTSELILNNFEGFTSNLENRPEDEVLVCAKYPEIEFLHAPGLKRDVGEQEKMQRRIARLQKLISSSEISFFAILKLDEIENPEDLDQILKSIDDFKRVLNMSNGSLHLAFRSDSAKVNNDVLDRIKSNFSDNLNIHVTGFRRNQLEYGAWGNPSDFVSILKNSGIELKTSGFHWLWERV